MIRPAETSDAAPIAHLWNPLITGAAITFNSTEKTPGDVAELIATRQGGGHGFWVAERAGKVLGFATYAQFRGGVGYARTMEHTIVVAEGDRQRGIGRALMQGLEIHARQAQVHCLIAGVSGENQAGIRFHQRLGFHEAAILRQVGYKFGRYMDLHLLQKLLSNG